MTDVTYEFHSPLTLLREWQGTDDALREFLVTGYTMDLVFLERYCVSLARGLGARVTVLADAGQALHEAVDVRHAGRAYQHGQASCGGAFHPKLVVLLGDDVVWAAIGSGNPTMAGWGHNHELWLVLRTSRPGGPQALADLGDWLIDLPDVVRMPSWIGATVAEIGQAITPTDVDASMPELRVFGNLRRAILGQLPVGQARSLRMSAPFFDARAQTVRQLIAHFAPQEVDIALQPTLSQYDGHALSNAVSGVPQARFWFLDEERTRHGKLVEWTVGERTTAMVGSANLSAAAMLATTEAGGNCELVTSYPVPHSLLPQDEAIDIAALQSLTTINYESPGIPSPRVVLLGARRLQDMIVVELATYVGGRVTIETSPDGTPGTWMPAHVVDATEARNITARFRVPEQVGSAVRARLDAAGELIVSSVVFLTDTSRCQPRDDSPDRPKLVRDYDLDEVFTDPVLASRFSADLLRLLSQIHTRKQPALARTTASTAIETADEDRWGTWIQDVERILGPSLTSVVFPQVSALPESGSLGWSVGPEADDTELAEGEDEDVVDDLSENPSARRTARAPYVPPSQRQRWRAWARRMLKAAQSSPRLPLEFRMTVAQLYVNLLAAGVWGVDEGWRTELRDVVRALVPTSGERDATPQQALAFSNSLTAVCVALLFQDADPHRGTERDLLAKSAWAHAHECVSHADPQIVDGYLYVPEQAHSRVAAETEVANLIDLAAAAAEDPDAELRAAFEQEDVTVDRVNGLLIVKGEFRNPRRIAARAATMSEARSIAVLARNERVASLVLRDGRTIAIAESIAPRWRVYQLGPVSTPMSVLGGDEGLPRGAATYSLVPPPPCVRQMAEAAGVDADQLASVVRDDT